MPRSSATQGRETRDRHQGRPRRHDGVAEAGGEGVAVAGGAAAGIGLAAGGQDDPARADRRDVAVVSVKPGSRRCEVADRLLQGQGCAAAVQPAEQGVEHVERPGC